jgi:hypothetical protein
MNIEVAVLLVASVVVAVAVFGCAASLYRFASERTKPVVPVAALLLIGLTALFTGLQFVFRNCSRRFGGIGKRYWPGNGGEG